MEPLLLGTLLTVARHAAGAPGGRSFSFPALKRVKGILCAQALSSHGNFTGCEHSTAVNGLCSHGSWLQMEHVSSMETANKVCSLTVCIAGIPVQGTAGTTEG